MSDQIERARASRYARPVITRSRLILEAASELVAAEEWNRRQVRVSLREQGSVDWSLNFLASDTPDAIEAIAAGNADIAMINPAAPVTLALRGAGPFAEPIAVRAIAVVPSLDRAAFAVAGKTGLESIADIRERRFPLKLSLRGHLRHSVHFFLREVLAAAGFTLEDIARWGGKVRYDDRVANGPERMEALANGQIDAIFDEAVALWGDRALAAGMRFLSLDEPLLKKLERMGFRRATITSEQCAGLNHDISSIDFSGWMVFTRAGVADEVVRAFCRALEARKDKIPWQGEGPLPLSRMCRDTAEGPLDVPLHPAAAGYWRERGYLD
jgi:TRAP-type uncharacterized transport system substrate-binding protein